MQFGIISTSKFFKVYKKLHEPVGRVQFVVFEKFTRAYLFQIAREKSFDYLLIIYMQKLEPDSSLIVFISCHGSLAPPTLTLLVENDRLD